MTRKCGWVNEILKRVTLERYENRRKEIIHRKGRDLHKLAGKKLHIDKNLKERYSPMDEIV